MGGASSTSRRSRPQVRHTHERLPSTYCTRRMRDSGCAEQIGIDTLPIVPVRRLCLGRVLSDVLRDLLGFRLREHVLVTIEQRTSNPTWCG